MYKARENVSKITVISDSDESLSLLLFSSGSYCLSREFCFFFFFLDITREPITEKGHGRYLGLFPFSFPTEFAVLFLRVPICQLLSRKVNKKRSNQRKFKIPENNSKMKKKNLIKRKRENKKGGKSQTFEMRSMLLFPFFFDFF